MSRSEAADRAAAAVASGDPAAYAPLREVTSVDGRPVDIDAVLAGDEADVSARLKTLESVWSDAPHDGTAAPTPAATERHRAAEVLEQDKFHEPDVPRPFRRPLRWLGDRLADIWGRAADFLSPVLGRVGSRLFLAGLLIAGLATVLSVAVRRSAKGQTRDVKGRSGWLVDPTLDPADLERQATDASAAGDHALAVRLRYEAGLLRLVAAGRLELRPETTATTAAAAIDHPLMDDLTATFEEIVYGGRPATAEDDRNSTHGWPEVLRASSAGRRGHREAKGRAAG